MRESAAVIMVVAVAAVGCTDHHSAAEHAAERAARQTDIEPLANQVLAQLPRWVKRERLPLSAVPGGKLFAVSGCTNCHTYLGSGSRNLGAPDLTSEGRKGRGVRWQVTHLTCPGCIHSGSPMPPFAALGPAKLHELAVFLEASKGPR